MSKQYEVSPEANMVKESQESPFDLIELWLVLWRRKWVVIGVSLLLTVSIVLYSLTLPNIYKSSALLSPQKSQESGSLASLAGQFGGLASMAGINLGGASDDTALHIETIKSKDFIYRFIEKYNVKVPLMAAKSWDKSTGKLIIDESLYSVSNKEWVKEVKKGESPEPSMFDTYVAFLKNLEVEQNKSTGFVTLAFKHIDPNISKLWVEYLIQDINALMRQQEIAERNRSILFLEKQLKKTNVAEMKNVFYSLIEEQTKMMLLAEVQADYVFKMIESPIIEERKVSPNRAVIAIVSAVFSGLFMCLITLFVHFVVSYKRKYS